MVGRDAELAELDAFLAGSATGFAAFALEGEPGIGKTTLWAEGISRAQILGRTVLVARPAEAEAGLSFAALADLVAPVEHRASSELSQPQRDALAAALLHTPAPEQGIDERAVSAAVLSLLRVLAAECPVVLAVDDAHWLDAPSARVLAFAARRLAAEQVGLLVTFRAGGGGPATFDAVADPSRRHVVRIGPLTVAALHELIKRHTGRSLARPILVQIARVSGGNPLYAIEIARELALRPPERGRVPIPATLGSLVEARIKRLPAATCSALLTAAALSHPTVELVEAAALGPAEDAGIVTVEQGRVRFTHPLFASAVYGLASGPARRSLHRDLATLVSDAEERARHLALGSDRPDERIALELDAGAAFAHSRGAPDAAAELGELALYLTPPAAGPARSERLLTASRFHFDAGDLERAHALLAQALSEEPDAPLLARGLQLLGQLSSRRSGFAEALATSLQALEAAANDQRLRAEIELDVAFYCVSLGDLPGAEPHARAAVELAEPLDDDGLIADALAVLTMVDFLLGRGLSETRMVQALALEDPLRARQLVMRPSFVHGQLLLLTGRLDESLETLEAVRAETLARGQESAVPLLYLNLVWACLWRGDLARAARFADESRETAALLDDRVATALASSSSALVHAHAGQVELAREEAVQAIALFDQLEWRSGTIWPLWALGFLELSRGDPAAVDSALGHVTRMVTAAGLGEPVLGVFLPDEIEALAELSRLEPAEALVEQLEHAGERLDRPWARAVAARGRGLLLTARGDLDGAGAALEQALVQHDRLDMPFERARTLLVSGRVLRRNRRRTQARQTLVEARTLFERTGARLWLERADAELRLLGRAGRADGLTPMEEQVAEFAASGLSNRQIAERAFLTVKAVEGNLTRVYRKLGIRSRGGLARALEGERTPNA